MLSLQAKAAYEEAEFLRRKLRIYGEPVRTGTNGVAYAGFTVTATSIYPPVTFAVVEGVLPTGITLDANTGVVSGTPGASATFPGIVIEATDANGAKKQLPPFSIVVT